MEKVVALVTTRAMSRSPNRPPPPSRLLTVAPGFDELLAGHELAWHQLWRQFRLDLRGGPDPVDEGPATVETLRVLRLSVFHLLQSASPHNVDLDAGIPARGLHGDHRGHVFWDELFAFPVLTLRLPGLARHCCATDPSARRRPPRRRQAGHTGAMYPWQSGSDGREETQRMHLNPLSERWLPDTSHLQRHVGLAVAYTIWQYYQATGDLEFLADHGAETLLEIARFFANLATYDSARDRFRIRGVMGPDEYSTRYPGSAEPGIDDNAYTNVLTVWLLLRARNVLDALPVTRRDELVESLALHSAELLHWDDVGRRMYVPIAPDGVISQFEGYRDLPELDWDDYRRRYGDIQRLDRILESEGRSVTTTRCPSRPTCSCCSTCCPPTSCASCSAASATPCRRQRSPHDRVLPRAHQSRVHAERVGRRLGAGAGAPRGGAGALRTGAAQRRGRHPGQDHRRRDPPRRDGRLRRPAAALLRRPGDPGRAVVQPALAAPIRAARVRGAIPRPVAHGPRLGADGACPLESGPGRVVRVGCGERRHELHPGDAVEFIAPGALTPAASPVSGEG